MKLLDWMHRKFRQNNNETPKDFSIGFTGQSSPDDNLHCYQKGYSCKLLSKSQRDNYFRNSFTGLDEDHEEEEEPPADLTELFHGFLAIGTLGSTDHPATPTFSISVDHIAEKETQVTENELKQINDELEKVLGADESCNASSGRNSQVSTERISYCSTITLSGKPIESCENYANEGINCPLQSYLFGSAIGLQDTATTARKEQRTSLGELFQKTKQGEDGCGNKMERSGNRAEKETDKSAIHAMKKMLKKRVVNARANSGGTMDSTTAETKLQKILQIFNRKVHPENSTTCPPAHNETKKNTRMAASNSIGLRPSAEDIIIYPQHDISAWSCNKQLDETTGNECWVKTDADYLVLEL